MMRLCGQSVVRIHLPVLGLLAYVAAHAQTLTPEMIVDMKWVTSVAMQPQGKYVAFTVRVQRDAEEEPGAALNELWVVPTHGGEERGYIRKPNSAKSIAWMPDGNMITFLGDRDYVDKNTQVYVIPLNGGEARKISHALRKVSNYALSPDGRLLAYTMKEEDPGELKDAKKKGFDQKVEDTWNSLTRIYVENLSSGETHLVTQADVNVWEFDWTPDGQNLIYRASERPFTDDRYMFTDNYIVSVYGGEGSLIHDTDGKVNLARMSPSGKYIGWLGAVDFSDPYAGSLFVLPANGGTPRNLLDGFEGTGESFSWKDDRTILLVTVEKNRTYLYEVSVPGGTMERLRGDGGPVIGKISLSKDKKSYATTANTYNHPNEVFVGSSDGNSLKRLSHSNPNLDLMPFGKQETISWKGADGLEIYGVLIKPVGYLPGKRYPLQVQVHGGPEGVRLNGWNTFYNRWVQMLAQRGYMVLLPNYRGSIGRGVDFAKGDHQDLMGKEFEDVLAGIDYLAKQGMIDPQRVGIGGGSYGGYSSAWAATRHSERFKAAVVFAGISNQISKAGMTDTPAENAGVHWDLWLYDHFDLVWDRSPLKHIKNAKTPTLILHGEKDKRVPLNQAYELHRGLKYFGVPTELVVYPREGHGNRERAHQIDACRRVLEWYDRYLME